MEQEHDKHQIAGSMLPNIVQAFRNKGLSQSELARLGRDLFAGVWPKDALRHSYGSYRNAILRNLDQVAEEMGNSVAMLHRHYHNPQAEESGVEWFALRPSGIPSKKRAG